MGLTQRQPRQPNCCFDHLFARLSTIVDTLRSTNGADGAPLLQNTMIAVLSEMGRTPQLNQSQGKDHWPFTSAMLISDGCEGGRVLGATMTSSSETHRSTDRDG